MDDALEAEQKRAILRQVAAYRDLCEQVRRGAKGSLFFGGLMLVLWWQLFPAREQFSPFGILYLSLAALEFATGLLNRFRPSAEGVLLDGLVLIAFGGSNLVRHYLRWEAGGPPFSILAFFAVYWLYQGYGHVSGYAALRRLFTHRPSAEHLRWFADLLHEVRTGNPETDSDALDLPVDPHVRAKLLGDTAIVLVGGTEVVIVAREQFEIRKLRAEPGDDRPAATLQLGLHDFGAFPLAADNWRNYTKWKDAGGPPVVHPVR